MGQEKQETKPAELESCVSQLISEGHTEESAYAICSAAQKTSLFIGEVAGYAAVFENVDKEYDVVHKGAFSDWLKANKNEPLPLLWVHEYNQLPLGITTVLKEDSYGLYYEAKILATKEGRDLWKAIESGAVTTASYRYKIQESEIAESGIRHISRMDISEISAVTKGMSANPLATIGIKDGEYQEPVVSAEPTTDETVEVFQAGLRQIIEQLGG